MTSAPKVAGRSEAARASVRARRVWGWPQYLAIAGIPVLVVEVWTIASWLARGPHQVTGYRDGRPLEFWVAHAFEAVVIVISLVVLAQVIRGCRAQRRVFTFDVMFLICAISMVWGTDVTNYFLPMFTFSSYWVNLNDPCGAIPILVNEDCGRVPLPIIGMPLMLSFGLLSAAMFTGALAERIQRRRPGLSKAKLMAFMVFASCLIVLVVEPLCIGLHLWNYPGLPLSIPVDGPAWQYPIFPEVFVFGTFIGFPAALRFFRDDRGRTFLERGLDGYSAKTRTSITLLAMYGFFQFMIWGPGTAPLWPMSWYQHEWPVLPASQINGMCDPPGTTATPTRYGPCPGSPGFRMPIPGTLSGERP
jgi:hypothetical protein